MSVVSERKYARVGDGDGNSDGEAEVIKPFFRPKVCQSNFFFCFSFFFLFLFLVFLLLRDKRTHRSRVLTNSL